MMKTIREILLEKHAGAQPKLDGIRRQAVGELRQNTLKGGHQTGHRTGSAVRWQWRSLFEGIPFFRGQVAGLAAICLLSVGLNLHSVRHETDSGSSISSAQLLRQASQNRKELLALIRGNNEETQAPANVRPRSHVTARTRAI